LLIISILVTFTIFRNTAWKTEISIWQDTVNKSPYKLRTLFNLARAYQKMKDLSTAKALYLKILHMFPDNADIYNNLGNVYNEMGRLQDAINHYIVALSLKEYSITHFNLAIALERSGNINGAIEHYKKTLELNPDDEEARIKLERLAGR